MPGCLRDTIPNLSRSALHRCLVRHGISRLPCDEAASQRSRFAVTEIGDVHVDHCELRTAEGKLHRFLAIDRLTRFAYVELHPQATMAIGGAFLRSVIAAFPYRIHTVPTDNGIAFADPPRYRDADQPLAGAGTCSTASAASMTSCIS